MRFSAASVSALSVHCSTEAESRRNWCNIDACTRARARLKGWFTRSQAVPSCSQRAQVKGYTGVRLKA